jgi:hypothetical protein
MRAPLAKSELEVLKHIFYDACEMAQLARDYSGFLLLVVTIAINL